MSSPIPTPVLDPITSEKRILTSRRIESWEWRLIDNATGKMVQVLDRVEEAFLTFDKTLSIPGGGSLTYRGEPIDWLSHRVQPYYTIVTDYGSRTWAFGVFVPAAPVTQVESTSQVWNVELFDRCIELEQDQLTETFILRRDDYITARIEQLFASAGVSPILTPSTEQATEIKMWEAGTTLLSLLNELCEMINYRPIRADAYGRFHVEPWQPPDPGSLAWEFRDDQYGVYIPEFKLSQDAFHAPNRVVQKSVSNWRGDVFSAEVLNMNPDDPLSYPRRGRWVTSVDRDVMALSQTLIEESAQRRMLELSAPAKTIAIDHAHLPIFLDDVVTFERRELGIKNTATVERTAIDTSIGGLSRTDLAVIL